MIAPRRTSAALVKCRILQPVNGCADGGSKSLWIACFGQLQAKQRQAGLHQRDEALLRRNRLSQVAAPFDQASSAAARSGSRTKSHSLSGGAKEQSWRAWRNRSRPAEFSSLLENFLRAGIIKICAFSNAVVGGGGLFGCGSGPLPDRMGYGLCGVFTHSLY